MLNIDVNTTMVRNPGDKKWELHDNGEVFTGKTRDEVVDIAHKRELQKIKRIKTLEQTYSRYRGLSLFKVNA